jgi:hypothetical protein
MLSQAPGWWWRITLFAHALETSSTSQWKIQKKAQLLHHGHNSFSPILKKYIDLTMRARSRFCFFSNGKLRPALPIVTWPRWNRESRCQQVCSKQCNSWVPTSRRRNSCVYSVFWLEFKSHFELSTRLVRKRSQPKILPDRDACLVLGWKPALSL